MNLENKKQIATLSLAIGLGLVAVFLMSQYIQTDITNQTKAIANKYKKDNQGLMQEMQKVRQQMELLDKKQAALSAEQKKLAARPFRSEKKEPAPVVAMESFSVRTPPGKRAITLRLDTLNAVGGLLNPGDFVDVIGHLDIPKDPEEAYSKKDKKKKKKKENVLRSTTILFQNVQILAVGTQFNPVNASPAYIERQKEKEVDVTLALTAQEASLLSFADENGDIQLTLRAPADPQKNLLQVASWETLSGYVYEKQGTELRIPTKKPKIEALTDLGEVEVRPFIQIFRGGEETNY